MVPELPWIGQMAEACPLRCRHDDLETLKKNIAHSSFRNFAKEAYTSEEGYSIRVNPVTNKREMFIAGTRDLNQWALNIYDGLLHLNGLGMIQIFDPWRFEKQNKLGRIAALNAVDIVYGHSRGGAIAADMPLPECTQRVGLDAAMILSTNKNMINLNEGGSLNPTSLFDKYIGQTGKKNITIDYSPFSPHKVWKV